MEADRLKIYSERFPLKYLFSDRGICLGVDTKRCSYLFLLCKQGILMKKRVVGDKIVETLNYEVDKIYNAIMFEGR